MAATNTVSNRIKAFNADLLPKLVERKYELLSEDPFRFYRGTCHIFYEDLAKTASTLPATPDVWLSGDLHLENFGSYKGDNRLVYFDISDFDEGILGPASWELARMITSIFVGFETLKISFKNAGKCANVFLKTYTETLATGKARRIELETASGIVRELLEKVSNRKQREWLEKRIKEDKNGNFAFREIGDKQLELKKDLKKLLIHHITNLTLYNNDKLDNFKVLDACFRIAGTGSLGLKRYIFLIETVTDKKRLWLLDMKQARRSSLSPYINAKQPVWESEAQRAISIKFRMQDVPEALLTTTNFKGDTYILQEMQPTEDKIDFHQVEDHYSRIYEAIHDMAMLTASAQLRSAGMRGSAVADDLMNYGKNDTWQKQIVEYAKDYAEQVKKDYLQYSNDYKHHFFR